MASIEGGSSSCKYLPFKLKKNEVSEAYVAGSDVVSYYYVEKYSLLFLMLREIDVR